MKVCAVYLVFSVGYIKTIIANKACTAKDKSDFKPIYPKEDSCAMSYEYLYD